MAKQTTITIETRSLLIVQARQACRAWCPECSAEAEMVLLVPGAISGPDAALLAAWLKSGDVHRSTRPDGTALICVRSLLARKEKPRTGDASTSPRHEKETT
ncbi:MAG TPA: hypothetical protein VL484_19200 [Vicinamibacterales bacterium]|jgi:hypothetical protein|nr:hypothetical protein [Vicinamibacterales bacterium]